MLRLARFRFDDDDHPLALEEVVLPLDRLLGLVADGSAIHDIVELAQRLGLALGGASERVSIVPATADIAHQLRIALGTDVVKLDRVTEAGDATPIEWRVAFARKTDRQPRADQAEQLRIQAANTC